MRPHSFLDLLQPYSTNVAINWNEEQYSYDRILSSIAWCVKSFSDAGISAGSIVALEGDYSPITIASLLALLDLRAITVPQCYSMRLDAKTKYEISGVQYVISVDRFDKISLVKRQSRVQINKYYKTIINGGHPGLVLFTSGTSGEPKAAVHNLSKLLEKFHTKRRQLRTLNFLLFDHWGGLNTLFHTLSNGGEVFGVENRSPATVCAMIEKYKIQLLPTSPTFLNLMFLSKAHKKYDLRSLKIISYGTESMPERTLAIAKSVFSTVQLHQTYGLIEVGVLRSKSRPDGSIWMKIGGEGYKWRIRNGVLQIKSNSAMLGYINAPAPFTDDGWFITGDLVEQDGEYLKILGRKSDLINVGGEKVYPGEVEDAILRLPWVKQVSVYGEKNPLMGNIVCALVKTVDDLEDYQKAKQDIKRYCQDRLEKHKVPIRINFSDKELHSTRFKLMRPS